MPKKKENTLSLQRWERKAKSWCMQLIGRVPEHDWEKAYKNGMKPNLAARAAIAEEKVDSQ